MNGTVASTIRFSAARTSASVRSVRSKILGGRGEAEADSQRGQQRDQVEPRTIRAGRLLRHARRIEDLELLADLPLLEVRGDLRLLFLLQQARGRSAAASRSRASAPPAPLRAPARLRCAPDTCRARRAAGSLRRSSPASADRDSRARRAHRSAACACAGSITTGAARPRGAACLRAAAPRRASAARRRCGAAA